MFMAVKLNKLKLYVLTNNPSCIYVDLLPAKIKVVLQMFL